MLHKALVPIIIAGASLLIDVPNGDATSNPDARAMFVMKTELRAVLVVTKRDNDRFDIDFGMVVTSSIPHQTSSFVSFRRTKISSTMLTSKVYM